MFRYDHESIVLSATEMHAFAEIVHRTCYLELQHAVSTTLARTIYERGIQECDGILRETRRMWR